MSDLPIFNEAKDDAFTQQSEAPVERREVRSRTRRMKRHAGRKPISEELPREVIECDPDESLGVSFWGYEPQTQSFFLVMYLCYID